MKERNDGERRIGKEKEGLGKERMKRIGEGKDGWRRKRKEGWRRKRKRRVGKRKNENDWGKE